MSEERKRRPSLPLFESATSEVQTNVSSAQVGATAHTHEHAHAHGHTHHHHHHGHHDAHGETLDEEQLEAIAVASRRRAKLHPGHRFLIVDGFGGLAGDMLVGALLDLGIDSQELQTALQSLNLRPWKLTTRNVVRQSLGACKADFEVEPEHAHRHLHDIAKMIEDSALPPEVVADAIAVFERLAAAEAKAHRIGLQDVHFHEVGAVDAILDVCAVTWCLHRLQIAQLYAQPLPAGTGTVACAHGIMPVPVPAVSWLLQDFSLLAGMGRGEMLTPTGSAILATCGMPLPTDQHARPHRILQVGYGAGTRSSSILRLTLIEATSQEGWQATNTQHEWQIETVRQLACTLDNQTAEHLAFVQEELMANGALDVTCLHVGMKKGRNGMELRCLVRDDQVEVDRVLHLLFRHTPTLGIRMEQVTRAVLPRESSVVDTEFGPVRVKTSHFAGVARHVPEYEDCARIARAQDLALSQVISTIQRSLPSHGTFNSDV